MSRGAVVYTVSSLQGKKSLAFRAAAIIVESGMLYLVVQVIFVTVFSLGNTADEVMAPMMVQFYVCSSPPGFFVLFLTGTIPRASHPR